MRRVRCGKCGNVLAGAGVRQPQAHERRAERERAEIINTAKSTGKVPAPDVMLTLLRDTFSSLVARGGWGSTYITDDAGIAYYCKRCHITYTPDPERPYYDGDEYLGHADRERPNEWT